MIDPIDRAIARAFDIAWVIMPVLIVGACSAWFWWPESAPPRDVVSDGSGGPETCYRKNVATVSDHEGQIAIVRAAYCPGQDVLDVGYDFYVVFVHEAAKSNFRDNIALQYVPSRVDLTSTEDWPTSTPLWLDGFGPAPTVTWRSAQLLEVDIPGEVQTMAVQRGNVDGIDVRYDGGPAQSWDADLAGPKNQH
ncbi:MAG TPA: hypothetical protein VEV38_14670 [Candidatus Eremiobacteraceae bacterium]|nr:hypothetical protein [Candidatus Eremiobacteraceae bacterium]